MKYYIITFFTGLLIGIGTTYFVMNKRAENAVFEAVEIKQQELDSLVKQNDSLVRAYMLVDSLASEEIKKDEITLNKNKDENKKYHSRGVDVVLYDSLIRANRVHGLHFYPRQ